MGWNFAEIWPIIRKGNVYQAQKVVERVCVFFFVCLFLFSLFLSVASIRFSVFLFAIFFRKKESNINKNIKKNQTNKQKNNEYNHNQLKHNRKKNNNNGKNKRNINQNKVRSDSRNYFW